MSKLTSGAKNGMYGKKHSPEVVKYCGEINIGNKYSLGRILSDDTKQKIGLANTGKRRTQEVKDKMSITHLGSKNGMYGKHHSIQTKKVNIIKYTTI